MNKIENIFDVVLTITEPYYDVQEGLIPGVYENITSRITDINIKTGIDTYEGPFQQSDTGQFTIVTRNPNLDPKVNPNVKYNSQIVFYDTRIIDEYLPTNNFQAAFFIGYITDINVEYIRNDDPIITITGVDVFGLLQKILVTNELEQEAIDFGDPEGVNIETLVELPAFVNLKGASIFFNFIMGQQQTGGSAGGGSVLAYRPAKFFPKAGEPLLEIITKYCQTNLDFMYVDYSYFASAFVTPTISFAPFVKYNGAYWPPQIDPIIQYPDVDFSSYPEDNAPYQNIVYDNGYKRVTNQLEFSNEYRTLGVGDVIESTQESFGTYASATSITNWGPVKTNIDTYFPESLATDAEMQRYSKDIFDIVASPVAEIQTITFDNGRASDIESLWTYSNYYINQFVRIKHEVNATNIINRLYAICGITHNISANSWTTSFSFKPSDLEIVYLNQGPPPTITMNSLTGDTNFNFTATITNYPTENIENVVWALSALENNPDGFWERAWSGDAFKDGLPRTGLTVTWNYDDDGILEEYGDGYWFVIPYVTLNTGWVIAPAIMLTVGAPTPEADFTWSQNLTNNFTQVTFTDTSRNNETGEPDSYLWDFGDGNTSTLQNPVHIYDPAPDETEYEVSLTVYALFGGGTNTHTETVTLTRPTMNPDFTYTQSYQIVNFTNISTNVGFEEPDAYFWDFDDGTTSTEKNPIHTFPADPTETVTFSVSLTTRNVWEQTATVSGDIVVEAINTSGTMPIRYVQLRQPSYTAANTNFYPIMRDFKGRTSSTLENLTFRHMIVHMQKTNVNFYNARGDLESTAANLESNLRNPSTTTPTYSWGIRPAAINIANPVSYKLTLDLFKIPINPPATTTQQMQNIIMGFKPFGTQPSSYPELEVWATDYTGSTMTNPDSYTWFKLGQWTLPTGGTLTDSDRVMTATATMPPNIP
jgi:PKD repeat protein